MLIRAHITESTQQYYFALACSLLCLLFGAYMYFVSASIVHVVVRKEVNTEISQLQSDISQLESQYIKRQYAINDDIALQSGFVKADHKIFLSRGRSNTVLTSNQPTP